MLGAWADLRGSMRVELDRHPSEGRLLFFVMASGLIWFFGRYTLLVSSEQALTMGQDEFIGRAAAEFVAAVFFRSLALYALAALAGAIAKAAGGSGDWRDSRAAMFWSALVAAPVILASTLLSLLLTDVSGQAAGIASMLGGVAFAWAVAHCFAEAHGFASAWRVFMVVVGLATGLAGTIYAIGYVL